MRRFAAPVLAVLALTGCAGEQGERAQALLTRAQVAETRLTSSNYEARVAFEIEGHKVALVLDGGAYLRGPRAGDQALSMRLDGIPGMGSMQMGMALRGQSLVLDVNGNRSSMTVPAGSRQQYDWSSVMRELGRHVKKVRVRENRVVNGEVGATVAGVIDTEGLLKSVLRMQSLWQASGGSPVDMSELAEHVSDTRAALFISRRTGLIRSAVVGFAVEQDGKKLQVDITYRLKNVNRAVPGL